MGQIGDQRPSAQSVLRLSLARSLGLPWRARMRIRWLAAGILASLVSACSSTTGPTATGPTGDIEIRHVSVVDVVNERILEDQRIVVAGGQIQAVEPDIGQPPSRATAIDGTRLVALPGFVDTHTHLWQHVAKSFEPNGQLQKWVRIYQVAHHFERGEVYQATLAAAQEALLSGITTVSDYASDNFSDFALLETCEALKFSGIDGAVVWWNPAAFLPAQTKERAIRRLKTVCAPGISVFMGPGTLSFQMLPEVYDGIVLARRLGLRLTEHTMENVSEQRDFHKHLLAYLQTYGSRLEAGDRAQLQRAVDRGKPPTPDLYARIKRDASSFAGDEDVDEGDQRIFDRWSREQSISQFPVLDRLRALDGFLAIHAVWLQHGDIALLKAHGGAVSYNPESNMYLGSGVAPVIDMMAAGLTVSIGTDGAASNDRIDFFSAMRAFWNLQKVHTLDPKRASTIGPWQVLRAATLDGAKALGIDDKTGSLDKGKDADIVLVSLDRLGAAPFLPDTNGASLLVNSVDSRAVDTVIANGNVVVRSGALARTSEVSLARQLTSLSAALIDRRDHGKVWDEKLDLRPDEAHVYRSVRAKDSVQIQLSNTCDGARKITLAVSGAVFGGTTAPMLQPETLQRFPFDPPVGFAEMSLLLAPNALLEIRRAPQSQAYSLRMGEQSLELPSSPPEQFLVSGEAAPGSDCQ